MNPTGAPDPLYVLARRVLLDALEALGPHRNAVILAGAQAVYLHTGPAGLAVAEYTTDADITIDPKALADAPLLEDIFRKAKFLPNGSNIGSWIAKRALEGREVDVVVDFLVPAAVGGSGRRGARLGAHGNKVARKAKGLEAVLADHNPRTITSLESADKRQYPVAVAGPAALLVAKVHKIADREGETGRAQDKDALDVLRLLRCLPAATLATSLKRLSTDSVAGNVSREAVVLLKRLFGEPESAGSRMAARAAAPLEPADTIAASCAALTGDLLKEGVE